MKRNRGAESKKVGRSHLRGAYMLGSTEITEAGIHPCADARYVIILGISQLPGTRGCGTSHQRQVREGNATISLRHLQIQHAGCRNSRKTLKGPVKWVRNSHPTKNDSFSLSQKNSKGCQSGQGESKRQEEQAGVPREDVTTAHSPGKGLAQAAAHLSLTSSPATLFITHQVNNSSNSDPEMVLTSSHSCLTQQPRPSSKTIR